MNTNRYAGATDRLVTHAQGGIAIYGLLLLAKAFLVGAFVLVALAKQ